MPQLRLVTNWNYVWCQTISDHWTLEQEVLGTIGALSNFRGVTVWGARLWQGLLRGKESIREGSLQSGQLLKMQQHHYSLTQPRTSVSLTASLCISPRIAIYLSSFWILSAATICSLFDILSHSAPLHIPSHHPSSFFLAPYSTYFSITELAKLGEHLSPALCERWPTEAFSFSFFFPRRYSTRRVTGQRTLLYRGQE